MAVFWLYFWPFVVYWLIVFVACYIVVEYGQNYFYDEATPATGLKVCVGSLLLTALLMWTRSSFDTMFTSELYKTVLQGIVWFVVFTLVFRFQPQHGAVIGVISMALVAGLATLGVDSLTNSGRRTIAANRRPSKPVRRPASSFSAFPEKPEKAPEVKPPAK